MTYDFGQVQPIVTLTSNWILSRVSDAAIFYHYHGGFKIGTACKSSLRQDSHPSVMFYIGGSGKIIYWDFSIGKGYDCFAYVQELNRCTYRTALEIIASDFGLIDKKTAKVSTRILHLAEEVNKSTKSKTLIQFTTNPWVKGVGKNLSFWDLYEITQAELETEQIFPVKELFLNKQEIPNKNGELRFAKVVDYEEAGVKMRGVKIYSPYDSNMKWLSSIPLNQPFGLDTLDYESNLIIITKSFKDMIVLKKMFTSVIACQNESEAALPDNIIKMLDGLFDKKIIIFDNDETGVTNSIKFNEKGFGYFNIPNQYRVRFGIKDPADFVKVYGVNALKELFKEKNLL